MTLWSALLLSDLACYLTSSFLCDPAHYPLNALHPHLQLHPVRGHPGAGGSQCLHTVVVRGSYLSWLATLPLHWCHWTLAWLHCSGTGSCCCSAELLTMMLCRDWQGMLIIHLILITVSSNDWLFTPYKTCFLHCVSQQPVKCTVRCSISRGTSYNFLKLSSTIIYPGQHI